MHLHEWLTPVNAVIQWMFLSCWNLEMKTLWSFDTMELLVQYHVVTFYGLASSAPLLWQSKISRVYFDFFVVFCRCQCHLVNTWYHLMHSITPTMSLVTFTVYQCQLIHQHTSKDRQSRLLLKVILDHRVRNLIHSVPSLFMLCDKCVWQWLVSSICFWQQLCGIGMYTA